MCVVADSKGTQPRDEKIKSRTISVEAIVKPPTEMSKLYPRIGKWQVAIRSEPGEALPNGGLDRSVMTVRRGPGSFSIVQNFHSRGTSGDIVGQSYTWWDAQSKTYRSVWCDNMQGCTEFTTVINGNSWTVELNSEAHGKNLHTIIQATMSQDQNSIHEEFINSYDGGPAKRETVNEYKRILPDVAQ
jgi:hypothetical protein